MTMPKRQWTALLPYYPTITSLQRLESRGAEHEAGVPVGDTTSVQSVDELTGLHSSTSSPLTFSMPSSLGSIYSCLPWYAYTVVRSS